MSTLDIFATIMDMAAVPMPTDRIYDSYSMVPLFTTKTVNTTSTPARESHFFYQGCTIYAVRHGPYKLHYITTAPQEVSPKTDHSPYGKQDQPLVFQIENDPGELWPVDKKSAEYNQVVSDVAAAVKQHQDALGTPPRGVLGDADPTSKLCCSNTTTPPCMCTPKSNFEVPTGGY